MTAVTGVAALLDIYIATVVPAPRASGLRWLVAPAALIFLIRHEPDRLAARLAPYRVTLVPSRESGASAGRDAVAV